MAHEEQTLVVAAQEIVVCLLPPQLAVLRIEAPEVVFVICCCRFRCTELGQLVAHLINLLPQHLPLPDERVQQRAIVRDRFLRRLAGVLLSRNKSFVALFPGPDQPNL